LGGRHSRIAVEDWIVPPYEITIGSFPDAIAITPDGTMAYVAKVRDGPVTLICRLPVRDSDEQRDDP
jgi:hypothetical protein